MTALSHSEASSRMLELKQTIQGTRDFAAYPIEKKKGLRFIECVQSSSYK